MITWRKNKPSPHEMEGFERPSDDRYPRFGEHDYIPESEDIVNPRRLNVATGTIIMEPDKHVWLVHPTNQYGGHEMTFPKGTVDDIVPGKRFQSYQHNAMKETYEESGLKTRIRKHFGDFSRSTSVTRYYLADRVGGHPLHMGWESEAVSLIPLHRLLDFVTHPTDREIAKKLIKENY